MTGYIELPEIPEFLRPITIKKPKPKKGLAK